jgi:hypothetical protein
MGSFLDDSGATVARAMMACARSPPTSPSQVDSHVKLVARVSPLLSHDEDGLDLHEGSSSKGLMPGRDGSRAGRGGVFVVLVLPGGAPDDEGRRLCRGGGGALALNDVLELLGEVLNRR